MVIDQFAGDAIDNEEQVSWVNAREIPAWAISLVIHLTLLVLLATIKLFTFIPQDVVQITSLYEEMDEEIYKFDTTVVDRIGNDSDVNMLTPSQLAATKVGDTPQEEMQQQLDEEILDVNTEPVNTSNEPNESQLLAKIDTVGASQVVKGGVEGAIDRLTYEIAGSLKQRKTLVVWLFDESGSMEPRRTAIADRFENVYKQLGMLEVDADKALKTAVVGYSDKTTFYTPDPIDDVTKAIPMVRGIKASKSPLENIFTAVEQVVRKWRRFRTKMGRNVMIIIAFSALTARIKK